MDCMNCSGEVVDAEGSGGREGEISLVLDTFYSHFDGQEWASMMAMETQVQSIASEMHANPAWPSNIAGGVYSMLAEALNSLGQSDRAAEMQAKADAILPPVAEAVVEEESDGAGIIGEHGAVVAEEGEILSVTLLVRHGARYPNRDQLTPFAEGSAARLQWEKDIVSTGSDDGDNLTPVGRAQMRALGARLVETGSSLLDVARWKDCRNLTPALLLLASTSPRCEESGDALARALCSGVNGKEDDPDDDDFEGRMVPKNLKASESANRFHYHGYEPEQRDAIFRAWNVNHEYRAAVTRMRNGSLVSAFAGELSRRTQLEALFNAVDRAGGVKAAVPTPTPAAMLFQCTHVANMLACEECREDGAGVLSAALSLEEKAFARRMARWVWEQRFLTLDEESVLQDPVDLERGCRVVVHGLTSSAGLLLNGKRGTLGGGLGAVRPGRYPIFMKGSSGEGYKHIKPCNVVREAGPAKIVLSGVMEGAGAFMNGVYERNPGYTTNRLPVYTRLGNYPNGVNRGGDDIAHLYSGNDGCWNFSSNAEHMQEGRPGLVASGTPSRSPLNLRWKVDSAAHYDISPEWNLDNVVTVTEDVTSHWREAIGGELWRFIACPPSEPHGVRVLLGHDYTLLALFAALGATRLAAALEFGAFVRIDHYECDVAVLTLCAAPCGEDGGAEVDAELKMIPIGRLAEDGTFCLHRDWCAEGFQPRAAAHHNEFKCRMCERFSPKSSVQTQSRRKHRMHRPFMCDECGCSSDPHVAAATPASARHSFGVDSYGGGGGGGMCGFTQSQVQELACQGLKPWDEDATAVMSFLQGGGDVRW